MKRSVAILGAVALLMLGFIMFFERGSVGTRERDERKGRVLDTFVRTKLVRLEIQRKGITTVLVRKPAPEEDLDLGAWQVEAPFSSKADKEAVDSVIGALEWIDARRTLHDVTAKDRAQFGLDKPRYRVSFVVGREHGSFSIGSDTPEGGGTYLLAMDPTVVYVVGKDAPESLDHDPAYFHTKDLHETNFSIYGARKLTLHGASDEVVVEKRGDYFWIARPQPGLASEPALTELVTNLDGLHAQRFVTADRTQLSKYGLDKPRFDALLESETYGALPSPGDKPHPQSLHVKVGAACAGQDAESYVSVDDGPIMCASNADVDKLDKSATALRDLRALVLDESQIRGVRVQTGTHELTLSEEGEGFRYERLDQGKRQDAGVADATAVSDWFKALQSATADSFSGAPPPKATAAHGASVVTFDRGKDKQAYRVVFEAVGDHVLAGRHAGADEALTLSFSPHVLELVSVSTARFRNHLVLDEKEPELRSLVLARAGGIREAVQLAGAHYGFEAPVAADVERSTIDDIARLCSKLEAVRFVADTPSPSHGLATPEYTLTLNYAADGGKPRRHTLRFGAETDGGRFAQLDSDPHVFIAPPALVSLLREPLVSRSALAVPLDAIASLRIEAGAAPVLVDRDADTFVVRNGGTDSHARAESIARALATLRAIHVAAYGAPGSEEGTDHPQAKVVITRVGSSAPPVTLSIGKPVSAEAGAGVYARRSDLALSFTLPRASVDALLDRSTPATTP